MQFAPGRVGLLSIGETQLRLNGATHEAYTLNEFSSCQFILNRLL